MLEKLKKIKNDFLSWLKTSKGKRLRRALPSILMIAMIFSIVLLTIFHSTDGFTTLVDTEFAGIVTEKSTMTFTGYILSDAAVVRPTYTGGVYYLAENGERVKPGDPIAKVYEHETDENVKELTERLDRVIDILEESIGDGKFTLGESKEVKDGISKLYYEMMRGVANGEASVISTSADKLLVLLNKMDSYVSDDTSGLETMLDEYRTEKNKLESYYKGNYQEIRSEYGGYFFRDTDGYENIYSSKNINELTYDAFFEMAGAEREETSSVGKILLDYKWYVAIPAVTGISDAFVIGEDYDMSFPDSGNRKLTMTLERIVYDVTGSQGVMLFACGTVDPSFDYLRVQQVNVANKNITGFRVPESAVCDQGGSKGVYILKDGRASFRKITILYQGDGYYIASPENVNSDGYFVYLQLNDRIITDCKNMYDGKVIE